MIESNGSTDYLMSELTVVQFETSPHGGVHLSELSEGPPFTVHGVALGAGDVTVGQSGIKKKWPATELESAADSLRGTNLVVDHNNDATGVVGRVTKSGYKEETGVVYEAELFDEDLAEKIKSGLLEVSIRGFHADVDSLEEDDDTDAKIVEDIKFDNLSIVPTGAAPSNTLQMGEHAELSAAELSAFTDELDTAELQEIEPGMWVTTGDTNGITISQVQDGEIEVDIYEKSDGKWRSTGETEMLDTDSLDEWDVDEGEDIGAVQDEEDSENEDEEENALGELVATGDKVQWDNGAAQGIVRDRKTDGCFNEQIDGDVEVCASEDEAAVLIEIVKEGETTGTMVAHKEGTVNDADFEMSAAQLEASDGDFVKWKGVNDEMMFGQIVSVNQDGQQMVADIRRFTKSGDPLDEIVQKPIQGLERWDRMSAGKDETPDDMRDDASGGIQAPDWQDGQMVKWQVNPEMKGKIVHVDRDKKVLMVEVMEETEQGLQPTGFTLTAGFQDVIPMDREMAAVTTRDMPTQDAPPTHDTDSVNNLLKRFIEEQGNSQPSLANFVEWMDSENLAIERGEGEEKRINSQKDLENSHEEQPHRYIDAEDEQLEKFSDYPEAASENAQMALDARENTGNPNDCGTDVGWKRTKQLANNEALTRKELGKMSAFNRHRQNSEMDEDEGRADCGWMMWKAWGGDEGVDWAMRKMDTIEEENAMADVDEDMMFSSREDAMEKAQELDLDGVHEMNGKWMPGETHKEFLDVVSSNRKHGNSDEDEEEMTQFEELQAMHEPEWDNTKDKEWNAPDLEDFTDESWEDLDGDEKEEIANHFLVSKTGEFPPERFSDLALPVVEPDGTLNLNALTNAKARAGQVEEVSEEDEQQLNEMINMLANENFEDATFGEEEEASAIDGSSGRPTAAKTVGGVRVLSGDDLRQRSKTEESDADSLQSYKITMTENIEEKLSELDEPVAVEAEEVEELRDKADRFEEMSSTLESLKERTDVLDEVDRSQVEELAESEDAVVVESARYEELQSEAEQVAGVYAAQLAEEYPAFDAEELTDKFSIEELREKFEEQIGDVEDLASSDEAEPRSQDADEKSLEEAADDSEESEAEELSESAADKQAELKDKILGGRR